MARRWEMCIYICIFFKVGGDRVCGFFGAKGATEFRWGEKVLLVIECEDYVDL